MQKKKTVFLSAIKSIAILAIVATFIGCSSATKKTLVPAGATMEAIYAEAIKDDNPNSMVDFSRLNNQTNFSSINQQVTQTTEKPVRVNNPDIALYVYAHPASTDVWENETIIVPSYTTYFPLYTRVHYQLNP